MPAPILPPALGAALMGAVNSRERCLAGLCTEQCWVTVASCCRCLSGYLGEHPWLRPPQAPQR